MPERKNSERSVSGDFEVRTFKFKLFLTPYVNQQDSDIESRVDGLREDSSPQGKPGRKKNPKYTTSRFFSR
jgi:hypothetical protein